jgi:hypothetical protein
LIKKEQKVKKEYTPEQEKLLKKGFKKYKEGKLKDEKFLEQTKSMFEIM